MGWGGAAARRGHRVFEFHSPHAARALGGSSLHPGDHVQASTEGKGGFNTRALQGPPSSQITPERWIREEGSGSEWRGAQEVINQLRMTDDKQAPPIRCGRSGVRSPYGIPGAPGRIAPPVPGSPPSPCPVSSTPPPTAQASLGGQEGSPRGPWDLPHRRKSHQPPSPAEQTSAEQCRRLDRESGAGGRGQPRLFSMDCTPCRWSGGPLGSLTMSPATAATRLYGQMAQEV